jgi:predicted DNA-binding protein
MAKKTETLHLRLDPTLRAQLEALAVKLDRPLAWVVRRALEAYLKEPRDE